MHIDRMCRLLLPNSVYASHLWVHTALQSHGLIQPSPLGLPSGLVHMALTAMLYLQHSTNLPCISSGVHIITYHKPLVLMKPSHDTINSHPMAGLLIKTIPAPSHPGSGPD